MAIAHNEGPETYVDIHLLCCRIVSMQRISYTCSKLTPEHSVCLCNIIRLVVLSRLEYVDLTCDFASTLSTQNLY